MLYSFVGVLFHEKCALIIRLRKPGRLLRFLPTGHLISHDHVQIGRASTYHRFRREATHPKHWHMTRLALKITYGYKSSSVSPALDIQYKQATFGKYLLSLEPLRQSLFPAKSEHSQV